MQSHFELFGLAPAFRLDAGALERAYREIQSRVHPDRHAAAGDAARRASMQWAVRANEAYRTLKSPLERARHLLELNGVDVAFETNTAMPPAFLMQQMEWRETLAAATAARDAPALERLRDALRGESRALEAALAERLDAARDYAGAAGLVRKLKFLDRLGEEVADARDTLEEAG